MQAVFALMGCNSTFDKDTLTSTEMDGKITKFIEGMLRERGENIQTEDIYLACMDLKEKYGYVANDLLKEFAKYDKKEEDDKMKTFIQSNKFNMY